MMLDWFDIPIVPKEKSVNPCVDLYGAGPAETTCAECVHLHYYHQSARWQKCDIKPRYRKGISGDHRVRWAACAKYEKRKEENNVN